MAYKRKTSAEYAISALVNLVEILADIGHDNEDIALVRLASDITLAIDSFDFPVDFPVETELEGDAK